MLGHRNAHEEEDDAGMYPSQMLHQEEDDAVGLNPSSEVGAFVTVEGFSGESISCHGMGDGRIARLTIRGAYDLLHVTNVGRTTRLMLDDCPKVRFTNTDSAVELQTAPITCMAVGGWDGDTLHIRNAHLRELSVSDCPYLETLVLAPSCRQDLAVAVCDCPVLRRIVTSNVRDTSVFRTPSLVEVTGRGGNLIIAGVARKTPWHFDAQLQTRV